MSHRRNLFIHSTFFWVNRGNRSTVNSAEAFVISKEEEVTFSDFLHTSSLCEVHRLGNVMKHQNVGENLKTYSSFYSSCTQQQFSVVSAGI